MYKATQQASSDIAQNEAYIYSLYDKLQLQALPQDKERARQIVSGYEQKINDMTQSLQDNPLSFRRKTAELTGLARTLSNDFTKGEAAAIGQEYTSVMDWKKRQLENKEIKDKQSIILAEQQWLSDYGEKGGLKWNPVTGKGTNSVGTEELYNTVDVQAKYDKYAKDKVAHIMSTATATTDGRYIYKEGQTTVTKSKEEIMKDLASRFMVDEESQNYLRQRSKIKALTNWYDEKDQLRTDENSGLATVLGASAESYWQDDVTKKTKSMSADGYGMQDNAQSLKDGAALVIDPQTGEYNTPNSLPATTITGINQTITGLEEESGEMLNGLSIQLQNHLRNNGSQYSDSDRSQYRSRIGAALTKALEDGDTKEMESLFADMGIQNQDLVNVKNQIKQNNQRIYNHRVQGGYYYQKAKKQLETADPTKNYTNAEIGQMADSMMAGAKQNTKAVIYETTSGEGFENKTDIQKGLKQISAQLDVNNFPTSAVIQYSERDADGNAIIRDVVMEGFELEAKLKELNATVQKEDDEGNMITSPKGNTKKRTVSKVLQKVSGIDQPYKVKYGSDVTVLIDPRYYKVPVLEQAISKQAPLIKYNNLLQQARQDALGMRDSKGQLPEQPKLKLADGVFYTPAINEGGLGDVTIDFGEEKTYKLDGKTITSQYFTAKENNAAAVNQALEILSKD